MAATRKFLDKVEPYFTEGGKLQHYYGLYEMVDTFLYTPSDVTQGATHVRDGNDLKRTMTYVVLATILCVMMAWYNTGYQANVALESMGKASIDGWRNYIMSSLGYNSSNPLSCMVHGMLYFFPIYIVTLAVGGIWEVIFATVRKHEINEGFLVSSMLFTLIMPPDIPLWQVALGISFGIVIGKEVFGGTGKNFLNPALTGRAFLFFAYPASLSGDSVWVAVDGFTAATPLSLAVTGGVEAITTANITWMQSFFGFIPGSIGETSTLACLVGIAFLLYTRIASYRIIIGVFSGMVLMSLLLNMIGSETNPMFSLPWYWHLTLGGFAFGMAFMATDPVSAPMTNTGRWVYGGLIGVMVVLIRVVNPAFSEGMMLAILFSNMFSPIIDYFVIQANISRRIKRHV
ncbi:MAG TPA: NADH:ubiquinone reductase (Na(+)-transporting) subunit B [Methylococcaceae bacterium]|jgi:Na+-transporting NADH:ubiquinone oxidoreductase subunit B|nr:NADH:ubiquinone reductase (Na(+)-transporting) subunit B [Methylococcaceae bacterium]HIN69078.1 NADH:ubiquinone reductase (Na(+)-transporting) subunit B [Methylococcales bacterium]HIA44834.1 NADH:ubiquinone reductase (Na(+)-transporting) subunit B [Methylococcaceae bacterium]HIB62362.1 NADH:ubiquinone reductase (Na(+)-transporting) subunit B [Methylococcaceae bacterium]HIO12429.1 NADH:ubiquinone reductase (Na(+)-transporting) subunit B [Methylococcales bacterium]